ncbi:hypothetical protein M0R45_023095 [Rubus argutus]|uniref:Uncharacterized protein n=1 Tax=Rubus argutus TaxID=59490 RepID=A0AAW1WRC0_RUBAR
MKRKWKDYYFDIAQNVAPRFINLKYVAVHYKNTKEVKYERLVTLTTCYNLSLISLNCMVFPEPSREDDLEIPPECPSASCIKTKKNELNLSEYLSKTWNLILLIPTDAKVSRQQIVDQNTNEQVENLVMFLEDLFPQADDGHFVIGTWKEFSNMIEKSDENAIMVGRAFIVCNIIINLIRGEWMTPEGTITELEEQLFKDLKNYFPDPEDENDEHFRKLYVIGPLKFLLDNFKWRVPEDLSRYNINTDMKQLTEVENTRFIAERKAMMSKTLNPLIQLIINDGGSIEKEKLEKLIKDQIDKRTIEDQIDLLLSMGCISQSNEDEIVLSETDKSRESIVERLKQAAAEAMKKLRDSSKRTMTYVAYMRKLEKAYKTRTALLKSKTERDVSSKRFVT